MANINEITWDLKLVFQQEKTAMFNLQLMSSFQEVAPKGSQMVPDEIRKELLRDIKKFLEEQAED